MNDRIVSAASAVSVCAVLLAAALLILLVRGMIRLARRQRAKRLSLSSLTPEAFEERVARYFRSRGYSHVELTPKSGDYGADVLATAPNGERVCVQCKLYSETVGVKAVQEIYAAKGYYGCEKAYVFATNSFTVPAQNMAEANDVTLVNVYELPDFCDVGDGRTFLMLALIAFLIAGLLFFGKPWEKLRFDLSSTAADTAENTGLSVKAHLDERIRELLEGLFPDGEDAPDGRDYVFAGNEPDINP